MTRLASAIESVRQGRPVVLVESDGAGSHGQIVFAAEHADADAVNLMATHARGIVCLCLTAERCARLGLDLIEPRGERSDAPAFTVSIEARDGISTGISAGDRAHTIAVAIDPATEPKDLVSPGHIFPILARAGGLGERPMAAEASVELARRAGLQPAAACCGILGADGETARIPELLAFGERHGLVVVEAASLAFAAGPGPR